MKLISIVGSMGMIEGDAFSEDITKNAFELGRRLVESWTAKTVDPVVKEKLDSFHQRMCWLMTYRKAEWPFEYNYWVTHYGLTV